MKVRPHEGVTVVAGGVDECGHGGEEEDTEKERKKIKRRRGGQLVLNINQNKNSF